MSKLLGQLGQLSAAEDFFAFLDVPYDAQVVNVARLHILRRMRQYLAEGLVSEDDAQVREAARAALMRAHADFASSRPIEQRVFKVLQEAAQPRRKGGFVPLSALTVPG